MPMFLIINYLIIIELIDLSHSYIYSLCIKLE